MGSLSRLAKKAITREINRQFLNAGYMEKWTDKWTLSRGHTIQGVIISPVKLICYLFTEIIFIHGTYYPKIGSRLPIPTLTFRVSQQKVCKLKGSFRQRRNSLIFFLNTQNWNFMKVNYRIFSNNINGYKGYIGNPIN